MKIRERIFKHPTINSAYKGWFYYTLGKAQLDKFTNILPEISAVIIIVVMVFGIDLKEYKALLGVIFLVMVIVLVLLGWFFKQSGLWDVEIKVLTTKNIVTNEMYNAAIKINKKFKNINLK